MYISLNIKNESLAQKIVDYLSSFKKEDVVINTSRNNNLNLWESENISSIESYNDRIKKNGVFSDDIRSF